MERVDTVVIGAGVVGLAVARALALRGREVIVLEAEDGIGTGVSARNSEVIHAGLYYPNGSLKARLCVAGRRALYAYCDERGIAYKRCGKLIVATTPAQTHELVRLLANGERNGVEDLRIIRRDEARAMEPELECVAALASSQSGIVDSHAYMLALQGDAERAGAVFAFRSPFKRGRVRDDGIELDAGQDGGHTLLARHVVNAASLHAPAIALAIEGFPSHHVPDAYYAKGNYFSLAQRAPFSRLIYPVPEAAGLGVHLTLDLAGQARFGPDVQWIDTLDYSVDPRRGDAFYAEVRKYWPGLRDGALQPAYAGIRPKIQAPGEPARDFLISDPATHGVPGLVHLFGIESPGLTASLALADEVVTRMSEH
ncbi:MAG TPA: NAD(P)/FAD-dependent oxidoreductase [Burkholderiaceae bacterium]|nr:NAD(P)/FAD-dependent oxidoreductase [Burkholderiaceae bacterium]